MNSLCLIIATILVVVNILPSPASAASIKQQKCPKDAEKRIEKLGSKLQSFGKFGRAFPENKTSLSVYCKESNKDLHEMDTIMLACYESTTKQLSQILQYSLRSVLRKVCNSPPKKLAKVFKAAKCANGQHKEMTVCVRDILTKFESIEKTTNKEKRFPHVCCEYYKASECIRESAKQRCPNDVDDLLDFFKSFFQSLVDVACGDYVEESDKCNTLEPLKVLDKSEMKKNYRSFFTPLLNIWESV